MRVTGATFPLHIHSRRAQVQHDRLSYNTVRLVAGLSLRRTGFDPTQFQVGILVDKVTLVQIFLRALGLCPVIIPSTLQFSFIRVVDATRSQ
jgi:hypothetical protein